MKKYMIRLVSLTLTLLCVFSCCALPAAALDEPDLQCQNAILVDATYADILYDRGAYEKAYPASITKLMTALLVLESIEEGRLTPSTPVTVSANAVSGLPTDGSTAGLKAGEQISVEELLYCLLLPSANEAANILAEAVDGSISEFVSRMNRRAGELGCKNTHFVNPHGLHDPQHYSCAYDISLMLNACLEHELYLTISKAIDHTVPATNLSPSRYFFNTNGLISNFYYAGYTYKNCIAGKTGTTDEGGHCLAAAAQSGDTRLISVVLGATPVVLDTGGRRWTQFTESTTLLNWGFKGFKRVTITREDAPVDAVAVTLSREADQVLVKPRGSITRTLPKDLDMDDIETEIRLFNDTVQAPVAEGQELGVMTLRYKGEVFGTLDLVAVTAVERSELLYKKELFLSFFRSTGVRLVLLVFALAAVGLILKLVVFRKRRRYPSRSQRGTSGRYRGNYRGGSRKSRR